MTTSSTVRLLSFEHKGHEPIEFAAAFRFNRTLVTAAKERWVFNWWRDLQSRVHVRWALAPGAPELCIYELL
jgi:hypothetical protein